MRENTSLVQTIITDITADNLDQNLMIYLLLAHYEKQK